MSPFRDGEFTSPVKEKRHYLRIGRVVFSRESIVEHEDESKKSQILLRLVLLKDDARSSHIGPSARVRHMIDPPARAGRPRCAWRRRRDVDNGIVIAAALGRGVGRRRRVTGLPHHPGEAIRQCGEEEDVEAYDQGDGVVWLDHRWLGSGRKPATILSPLCTEYGPLDWVGGCDTKAVRVRSNGNGHDALVAQPRKELGVQPFHIMNESNSRRLFSEELCDRVRCKQTAILSVWRALPRFVHGKQGLSIRSSYPIGGDAGDG